MAKKARKSARQEPPTARAQKAAARRTATRRRSRTWSAWPIGSSTTRRRSAIPISIFPTRALSNVRYNKTKRRIEMGSNKNRRQLFNLSQAKSYMQTVLVASGCKQLIEQGKTTSMRGLFYLLKHTIEGTREETFDDQAECDPVIEDVEVGAQQPARGAARLRLEPRQPGRPDRRWSTAATKSTARGWARPATAFPRSSSAT